MASPHPSFPHHHHHHHHQEEEESSAQKNPAFLLDDLYCSEEHWEEEEEEEAREDYLQEDDCYYPRNTHKPNPFPVLLEQDLFWDDEELISLFSKEQQNELYGSIKTDPYLAGDRREAVEWMLKVNACYSFSALTAVLAVNYLDRFLSAGFRGERARGERTKPWMIQLASVACLSLAAKVEETHVPLLLDFQVEEARYLYEAKTIMRMEILVLTTLRWDMNPVTPLSFLDYITRRLGLKDHLCYEFLRKCERVLLSVLTDSRFISYLPSIVAAATMLHVVNTVEPCLLVEYQSQLWGILGIDKDKIDGCCRLILELAASGGHGNKSDKRKLESNIPGSPKGVVDVSFSSDSSNDSCASSSVSSSTEPLSKKSRAEEQLLQSRSHQSADFLSIPR